MAGAMHTEYPERFAREMACTEAEWLRWLPQAIGAYHWKLQGHTLGVRIGDGALGIQWQVLEPRCIGLLRMPRMEMHFRFGGVDASARSLFMRQFDLYMHRGGG